MNMERKEVLAAYERFDQPNMPFTLWRSSGMAIGWLVYGVAFLIIGFYVHSLYIRHAAVESKHVAESYHLSNEHFIYKKRPLPEIDIEDAADDGTSTRPSDEAQEPGANADLKARVKQAMAEIDQQ